MAQNTELRDFVEEIEDIEDDTRDLNLRKAGVYKKVRARGYNVKALKEAVGIRRKHRHGNPIKMQDHDRTVQDYLAQID